MIEQEVIWLPLLLQIPIHELGHYVGFRACGQKPKVTLNWFGPAVGDEQMMAALKLRQLVLVISAGVLYGLTFLCVWDLVQEITTSTMLVYLVVCALDLAQIIAVIELARKKGWNKTLAETGEMI